MSSPYLLPTVPEIPEQLLRRVRGDFDRFARDGLPPDVPAYLLETYHLDVSTTYAGLPVRNPWGKASGQLSMTAQQVADDVEAGLGFIVLKTVIAEDATGGQSMKAWAVPEARMVAERICGQSGEEGWTVSWKGRGWWQSFEEYLNLVRKACYVAAARNVLVVPSCKYHLPTPEESSWRVQEYRYTTGRLLEAYRDAEDGAAMPIEKDFSPTLAGSDRATQQAKILEWLREVPGLIRDGAMGVERPGLLVGLKLFNALFDDAFQLEMLRAVHEAGAGRPDFLVYGNRLFDPERVFEGHRGIAYGGPDLSDRNLRVLDAWRAELRGRPRVAPLEVSATGNICSGKMAVEYLLRGCTSFQLHTYFQLPSDQYAMQGGSRTQKALHMLYFHPDNGLVVWLRHLAGQRGVGPDEVVCLRDLARRGATRG